MEVNKSTKPYDLEERTFLFAFNCRILVKLLPKSISNTEDSKQLIRSSGSIHANFIESVEALSKKDSLYRLKICRKEAKESKLWIKLTQPNTNDQPEQMALIQEASELTKIFSSIVEKVV